MTDEIRPEHYKDCSIDCLDAMEIAYGNEQLIIFCVMNAFKYLWRYKHKNGLEDLQKAKTYINIGRDKAVYFSSGVDVFEMLNNMEGVLDRYLEKETAQNKPQV